VVLVDTKVHTEDVTLPSVYVEKPDRSIAMLPDPAVPSPTVTVTEALCVQIVVAEAAVWNDRQVRAESIVTVPAPELALKKTSSPAPGTPALPEPPEVADQ
jgi:hypothetical protein